MRSSQVCGYRLRDSILAVRTDTVSGRTDTLSGLWLKASKKYVVQTATKHGRNHTRGGISRCGDTVEARRVKYLALSLGGALGANARYILGIWMVERYGTRFPYGTLLINVSGSFVLGLFLTLISERFVVHPNWRLFFAAGFLGAYTTFSTFSFESMVLILNGSWWLGLVNMVGSVVLGLLAVVTGMVVARLF